MSDITTEQVNSKSISLEHSLDQDLTNSQEIIPLSKRADIIDFLTFKEKDKLNDPNSKFQRRNGLQCSWSIQ